MHPAMIIALLDKHFFNFPGSVCAQPPCQVQGTNGQKTQDMIHIGLERW